jgi:hypothetical protein
LTRTGADSTSSGVSFTMLTKKVDGGNTNKTKKRRAALLAAKGRRDKSRGAADFA